MYTALTQNQAKAMDDWKSFAMELWGLSVTTWTPLPERAGKLPEPLQYDTLHDGLVELETGQRQIVLQCLSCYQAGKASAATVISTIRTLGSKSKTFKSIFDDLSDSDRDSSTSDESVTFDDDSSDTEEAVPPSEPVDKDCHKL